MKRQLHENEVRSKIIQVARRLFLSQGYEQTRIRQIKEAAEVKIGTIYHFYQNKEDILAHIVRESFFRVLVRARQLAGNNQQLNLGCELAWHIHTMHQHPQSAEMYLISYNSPRISAEILSNQVVRSKDLFGERCPDLSDEDHQFFSMVAKGMMQSITLRTVNGVLGDPDFVVDKSITVLLKLMDIPAAEIEATRQQIKRLAIAEKVATLLPRS